MQSEMDEQVRSVFCFFFFSEIVPGFPLYSATEQEQTHHRDNKQK